MKNLTHLKRTALSLSLMLSNITLQDMYTENIALHKMYTESDLQFCEFLSTVHGDHKFILECERPEASDLYLYQCIKTVSNDVSNDTQMHFPTDVIGMIMSTIRELRKDLHAPCYKIYCFKSMPDVIISFIKDELNKKRSHAAIAHTLQAALQISGKSLSEIKCTFNHNVFEHLVCKSYQRPNTSGVNAVGLIRKSTNVNWAKILCLVADNVNWAKILCLVVEDRSWNMIINNEKRECPLLSICKAFNLSVVKQVLSTAPNKEAIWKVVCTPIHYHFGDVLLLNEIIKHEKSPMVAKREPLGATLFIVQKLLSCAPNKQEAWKLINTPDQNPKESKTALDVAIEKRDSTLRVIECRNKNTKTFSNNKEQCLNDYCTYQWYLLCNIVQLLESYRPT